MAEIALGGRGTAQFGRTMSQQRRLSRTLMYVLMLFLLALFGFPLYYMVIASLMTQAESYAWPPLLYPKSWVFANYPDMLSRVPFVQWFWNTVVIAFFQVLGATASSTVVPMGSPVFASRGAASCSSSAGHHDVPGADHPDPTVHHVPPTGLAQHLLSADRAQLFGAAPLTSFTRQFIMQLPRDSMRRR